MKIGFLDPYIDDDYIYAANFFEKFLFRINRKSYKFEYLTLLNGFLNENGWKIRAIYRHEDKLFLFSAFSLEVASYDLITKKTEYFHMKKGNMIGRVAGTSRVGDDIWIISNLSHEIYYFSLQNLEFRKKTFLIRGCENFNKNKIEFVGVENTYVIHDRIWRCIAGTNYVMYIDIKKGVIQLLNINCEINLFSINYDGFNFYFVNMEGTKIVCWNENLGVIDIINIELEEKINRAYRGIYRFGNNIIAIPCYCDDLLIIHSPNCKEIVKFPSSLVRCSKRIGNLGLFLSYSYIDKQLLLFPWDANGIIRIDCDSFNMNYYPAQLDDIGYVKYMTSDVYNLNIMNENSEFKLSNYVNFLKLMN